MATTLKVVEVSILPLFGNFHCNRLGILLATPGSYLHNGLWFIPRGASMPKPVALAFSCPFPGPARPWERFPNLPESPRQVRKPSSQQKRLVTTARQRI